MISGFLFCTFQSVFLRKRKESSVSLMKKKKLKITVKSRENTDVCFERFLRVKRADGITQKTMDTYSQHFRAIGKHLDTSKYIEEITDIMNMHNCQIKCFYSKSVMYIRSISPREFVRICVEIFSLETLETVEIQRTSFQKASNGSFRYGLFVLLFELHVNMTVSLQ